MKLIKDEAVIAKLKQVKRVAVLTGAGISAESGIPTFRGENGLWKRLSPAELASFEAFYKNTAVVSEWYQHRREIIENTEPNPGHYALRDLEKVVDEFQLVTQNIDGLHQKAGSQNVVELHGNIHENYCINCHQQYTPEEFDEIYNSNSEHIPRCSCGGLIRPDVVWYGEQLPVDNLEEAYRAAIHADLFFSIGTSAQVVPAANLPRYARESGAFLIEVNTNQTAISDIVHLKLTGCSGEILPDFVEDFKSIRNSTP